MPSTSHFLLRKWYLDGVSSDGRTIICYSARLTWRGLSASYASYLYLKVPGQCLSESRFREAADPVVSGQTIRWQDPGFKLSGTWESAVSPVRNRLFEGEAGWLDWHCHHPASRFSVTLGDESPLEGFGYVECLEMTLPPWKLGFDTLRWGRFAHPKAPLAWIDWKGDVNRSWVFDGQAVVENSADIRDDMIVLPQTNKKLLLQNPVVIEDKDKIMEVMHHLVSWLPGIDLFTPARFLRARETKWRSEATLQLNGTEKTGWAIHELVTF